MGNYTAKFKSRQIVMLLLGVLIVIYIIYSNFSSGVRSEIEALFENAKTTATVESALPQLEMFARTKELASYLDETVTVGSENPQRGERRYSRQQVLNAIRAAGSELDSLSVEYTIDNFEVLAERELRVVATVSALGSFRQNDDEFFEHRQVTFLLEKKDRWVVKNIDSINLRE